MKENDTLVNELLGKPCYVIDYLPVQVSKDAGGQFFKVENYLLNHDERCGLRNRFACFLLKLMCYERTIVHWGGWIEQPAPEQIAEIVDVIMDNHSGFMNLLLPDRNALLVLEWDCLNLTLYNPDEALTALVRQLAQSEGLFFRKGEA